MEPAGIHEDVVVAADIVPPADPGGRPATTSRSVSIAELSAEVLALSDRLEAVTGELARMVRDGSSTDAAHGAASRDVLVASGRLAQVSTVLSAVAFVRMEVTRACVDDGFLDEGRWAARHAGLSNSEVGLCRRISRCVARYPQIAEAFLTGEVRGYHLAAIDTIIPERFCAADRATAVELVTSIQGELLAAADTCETEREFRRFCAQVRRRLDCDGPAPPPGSLSDRSELSLRPYSDGRWLLHGDLSPDDGALWATLLEDELRRTNDSTTLASNSIGSDRSVGDDSRPGDGDGDGDGDDDGDGEWVARSVRLADSARSLLLRGAATRRPGRIGLFVHLDLNDLIARGGTIADTPLAHTEAGYDISDDTLWALLADADVTPVITLDGSPLSFGRTRRLAPDILRRVLAHRDRTCCFPGCDTPAIWLDQHHTITWAEGGSTDPATIRGLCRAHHRLRHAHKWGLHPPDAEAPATSGNYVVTHPDGTAHDPTPRWRRRRRHDPYRTLTLRRLEADLADRASTAAGVLPG